MPEHDPQPDASNTADEQRPDALPGAARPASAGLPERAEDAPAGAALSLSDTATTDAAVVGNAEPPETPARPAGPKVMLCPYCGHTQTKRDRCGFCGGLIEPLSRRATQIAMGPWYLRDLKNPFRPGCSYEVLKRMIDTGKIGPTTVMRGPTTRQFWAIARNVPGIAHLLGYCHACGKHTPRDPAPGECPFCKAPFKKPRHRNELGLQFPTRQDAEAAQRTLDRELSLMRGDDQLTFDPPSSAPPGSSAPDTSTPNSGGNSGGTSGDGTGRLSDPAPTVPDQKAQDPTRPRDLLEEALGIDLPPATDADQVHALDFAPQSTDDATPPQTRPAESPPPTHDPRPAPSGGLPDNARAPGRSGLLEPTLAPPTPPPQAPIPTPRESTAPAPRTPINPITLLLIALNVLVLLGLILYLTS